MLQLQLLFKDERLGLISCILVFLLGVLSYLNSYNGEFVFDDSEAIQKNLDVRVGNNAVPLIDLFFHDFWGTKLISNISHKSYRPLTVLTFRLNNYLAGELRSQDFHLVNIILHGAVSVIYVIFVSVLLSEGKSFKGGQFFMYLSQEVSALSGVLFAVIPIHSESVASAVGRADLLSALCFLVAFIVYVAAVFIDVWLSKFLLFFVHALLVTSSMLFKEPGITVIGICCIYDIVVLSKYTPWARKKEKLSTDEDSCDGPRDGLVLRQIYLFLLATCLLSFRWYVMGSHVPVFQVVDNPHSFVNSTVLRMLNFNYLYAINIWLLLSPTWLCFDWSMGCIPVITEFTDYRLVFVIGLWLFALLLIWRIVFYMKPSMQRRVIMSLSLIVVPFLPASNLLFRVGFVIAERNLYLPSCGFVLLLVLGIQMLSTRHRVLVRWCVGLLVLLNVCRCLQRSAEWTNELRLFTSGLKVCPLNAKVHYNIAKVHRDIGNVDYAIEEYKEALRLHPKYDQAMNNLANIYKDRGQLVEAERLLADAVTVRSDFAAAWMNLGIVQMALKKYTEAEQSYKTALSYRRRYADCHYNLGNLYLEVGRHSDALSAWQTAVSIQPNHVSAWTNAVILLGDLGKFAELDAVFAEATKHNPLESPIHFNYASSLGKAGRYLESEKHFLVAIEQATYRDNVASYYANLGVLYHRWGKLKDAEQAYKKSLALDHNNQQTIDNFNLLARKLLQNAEKHGSL